MLAGPVQGGGRREMPDPLHRECRRRSDLMKGLLLRVAADTTAGGGGWNGPIEEDSGEFLYVPIPQDLDRFLPGNRPVVYDDMVPAVTAFSRRHAVTVDLPQHLLGRGCHLDPNFDELTYGDQGTGRGNRISKLERGDFIAFFGGLKPTTPRRKLVYGLIGIMFVDRVVTLAEATEAERARNAHGTRTSPDTDLIVFADPRRSGRLRTCIPIGEWRGGAYRVRRDLLDAWGGDRGIGVRDGWIQRSVVPPWFDDPERFLVWFKAQNPRLVAANNPVL